METKIRFRGGPWIDLGLEGDSVAPRKLVQVGGLHVQAEPEAVKPEPGPRLVPDRDNLPPWLTVGPGARPWRPIEVCAVPRPATVELERSALIRAGLVVFALGLLLGSLAGGILGHSSARHSIAVQTESAPAGP